MTEKSIRVHATRSYCPHSIAVIFRSTTELWESSTSRQDAMFSLRESPQRAHTVYPPPLAQARLRSQNSGQNGGSTPTPCLDKAVHARDTCDSKGVGEPSDGDGEGLRMGKRTLSKAAFCSIYFPFRMYFKWM